MTRGICCILLGLAIFAPLVRKIYKWNPVSAELRAEAQQGLVEPSSVSPEPGERTAYIVGCLLALPLLCGLLLAFRFVERRSGPVAPRMKIAWHLAAVMACWAYGHWLLRGPECVPFQLGLLCGLMYLLYLRGTATWPESRGARLALQIGAVAMWIVFVHWALRTNEYFPVLLNLFYQRPLWIVPVVLLSWPVMAWLNRDAWAPRWFARALVGFALAVMLLASWMGDRNPYAVDHFHFAAAFDPVAQVQLGKDLLVDYDSQYGLYPDLLAPLFAVIGLNVLNYTLVFGLLTVGSFGLLWWVLGQAVSRRGVALIGFVALIFNGWLMFQLHCRSCHPGYFDPYFQYMPIRLLFPASAVALTWAYHSYRSARIYWFANIWLAVGVLWNLDGGCVAIVAWLCGCMFDALYAVDWRARVRGVLGHIAATLISLVGVFSTYALIKYACFGVWPQFGRLTEFQRLFYMTGFYMWPMRMRGIWILVVLVYLAGLTQGVSAALGGQRNPRTTLTFVVSVLGLGLFSYYQGRSQDFCLIICWWPALILLPIYWDQLLDWHERRETRSPLVYALASTIGLFLISSAVSFLHESPSLCPLVAAQCAEAFQPGSPLDDDTRLLREHVPRNEEIVLLSASAPVLHLRSGNPSLAPGGLMQMLWMAEYETLLRTMEARERSWVFIDRDFENQFFIKPKQTFGTKFLLESITDRLEKIGESPHGVLYEFHGRGAERANVAATRPDKRGG